MPTHEDLTHAAVDIRDRESTAESWSDPRDRVDRTRTGGAVSNSSLTWTTRAGAGGVAITAVTVALFLSAPAAFADNQPTGTTTAALAGQTAAPTDGTTPTTSTDTGTPASDSSTSPQGQNAGGTDASPSDPGGGANADSGGGNGNTIQVDTQSTDPGTTGGSTSATGPPGGTTSADEPTSVDNPPSSNQQSTSSGATANQSGANNGNVSVQVGQGGDTGSVSQGNQATSEASSQTTGTQPQDGSDPSATGTATTEQDSPNNSNVAVLVGSPGQVGSVQQQNNAQADAAAAGTTNADGTGGGGVGNANSTQTSPGNVNVTVRVGSPGDNGDVTQQNTVGASAGSTLGSTPTGAPSTDAPATTDQTVSTSNQGNDVTNAGLVDQELLQTQDGAGPDPTQSAGDAVDLPMSSTGSATATQTGAYNINVSIRVASPGNDGGVAQTNSATATGTSPELGIVKSSDGSSYNVSIVLPGSAFTAPGDQWQWNWNWTGDGTPPAGASADDLAPTSGSAWNWSWTSAGPTTPAANTATTPSSGTFTWSWTWLLPNGQTWTLSQQQACSCNWQWNWTWDWSAGAPSTSSGDAPATGSDPADSQSAPAITPADNGPITQWNSVDASATAAANFEVTPLYSAAQSGADPSVDTQALDNGQSISNNQVVSAIVRADQINPSNFNLGWGVGIPIASITQANVVAGEADATGWSIVDQELIQGQDVLETTDSSGDSTDPSETTTTDGAGGTTTTDTSSSDGSGGTAGSYQWIGAQQTAVNTQNVSAQSQAFQKGASNMNFVSAPSLHQAAIGAIEQLNRATTSASALSASWLTQQLAQFQDGFDNGTESAAAIQEISNSQSNNVFANVFQTLTRNLDNLLVPAGSRATNPTLRQRNVASSTASAENWSDLTSVDFQYQGGTGAPVEDTSAIQQITVVQNGVSPASPVSQNNLLNQAGWLGIEPPPPPAPPSGGDQGGGSTGGGGTTSSTTVVATTTYYSTFGGRRVVHQTSTRHTTHNHVQITQHVVTAPYLPPALSNAGGVAGDSAGSWQPPAVPPVFSPSPAESTQQLPSTGSCSDCAGVGGEDVQLHPHTAGGGVSVVAIQSQGPTPWFPSAPNDQSAGSAASGSAPSTGSGQTALAFGPYKLAAPLVTGSQMPAPALGLPVIYLDPFERPG